MKNKAYIELAEEKFNKDNNYNVILSRMKEEKVMKKRKIVSIVAVLLVVIMVGAITPAIYAKIHWDIEFKEYKYMPREEEKGNLDEVRESDYAEVLNMNYLVQDGIGVKVNKILLTEDCLDANITFKFPEDMEVNSQTFNFGHAVYDENNNIYDVSSRIDVNRKAGDKDYTIPFLFEELGVKYDKRDIYGKILNEYSSLGIVEVNDEEKTITCNLTLYSEDTFPKSNKLYIRVFDIGYYMLDFNGEERTINTRENFDLSNSTWIFEIDVPEKFYENKMLELKTLEDISGLNVSKITLTEACLVVRFNSDEYREMVSKAKDSKEFARDLENAVKIVDGEGKEYQNIATSSTPSGAKMIFDIGKKDLAKKLYLKYTVNGNEYVSELVEK